MFFGNFGFFLFFLLDEQIFELIGNFLWVFVDQGVDGVSDFFSDYFIFRVFQEDIVEFYEFLLKSFVVDGSFAVVNQLGSTFLGFFVEFVVVTVFLVSEFFDQVSFERSH